MQLKTASALLPNPGSSGKDKVRHAKHAGRHPASFETVLSGLHLHRGSGQGDAEKGGGDLQDPVAETKNNASSHEDEKNDSVVRTRNSVKSREGTDHRISRPEYQCLSGDEEPLSQEETSKTLSGEAASEDAPGLSEHVRTEEKESDDGFEPDTADNQPELIPDENEREVEVQQFKEINPTTLIISQSESKENTSQVPGQLVLPKGPEERESLSSNQDDEQCTRSSASQDSSIGSNNRRSTTTHHLNSGESSSLTPLERNGAKAQNTSPERTDKIERLVRHEETNPTERKGKLQNSKLENLKPSHENGTVPQTDTSSNWVSSRNLKTPGDLRPKSPPGNSEERLISKDGLTFETTVSGEETSVESEPMQRVRNQNRLPVDTFEQQGIKSADSKPQQENHNPNDFSSGRNNAQQDPADRNALTSTRKESFDSFQTENTVPTSESILTEVQDNTTDVLLKSAQQGYLRDPDSRGPEASPLHLRGNGLGLWIRNILQRHEHRFAFENGWNVLEMQLDGNDGSMVVKARREDDRVAITVGFSDSNLRALAQAHLGDLKEALQTHYNNTVEFSLSGEGSGNQDAGRRMEQPKRTEKGFGKQSINNNQPSIPGSGNAHEWIG